MSDAVIVVDYGAGNTRSVCAALNRIDRASEVSSDAKKIGSAPLVILPGVGSARSAMAHLTETGAADALVRRFRSARPIVGICLGLQLALEFSEEDGGVKGLGLISGNVRRLTERPTPRLGWEIVEPWGDAYYFAHSFFADSPNTTGWAEGVPAVVQKDSFMGVQFHPEKSGPVGSDFLLRCL